MRLVPVLSLIALCSLAVLADTPKPKQKLTLSAADQKKYKELLKKGRALEAKKKHAEAVAAFEECVKVSPDDAVALSELGWAAFQGKDLKKAEAATRKAIANQAAPTVRGAALYNLGRIQEEQKNKPGAIASYSESLRARPNAVVRARLRKLDPKAATAFDPFAPVTLAGPFASIDAYCTTTPKTEDEDGDPLECTCGQKLDAPAMKLGAPYEQLEMFTRVCQLGQFGTTHFHLAAKTGKGWFVGDLEDYMFNRHCDETLAFKEARVADVTTAPGPEALMTYTTEGGCAGGSIMDDWSAASLVVIGTGASGVLAATPPIQLRKQEHHQDDAFDDKPGPTRTVTDLNLKLTWNKDGSLDLEGKTTGLDKAEAANLLGKHTLAFR